MNNLSAQRLSHWCLGLLSLWLVAEFVLLGPSSVVWTGSNGEVVVPALLSERYAESTSALWQNLTSTGSDKSIFTYYSTIDTFLLTTLPGWLAHGLRVSFAIVAGVIGAYALARKVFGFGRTASLFVGAANGVVIKGYLLAAVIAFLPILLLSMFYVLAHKKRLAAWIALGIALYVEADTSYFSQLLPWVPATIIYWFIFADTRTSAGDWAIILGSCLVLVLLRLDNFYALFANVSMSHIETARDIPNFAETLRRSVIYPFFLGGPSHVACATLFVYGLVADGWKIKKAQLVGVALLIGMFLYPAGVALQHYAAEFFPFLKGYSTNYAQRISIVILPFAAGWGVEALVREVLGPKSTGWWGVRTSVRWLGLAAVVGAFGFVSLKIKYTHLYNWVTNGSYVHNFASPAIEAFATTIRNRKSPVRVETFQIIPNYLHAYGLETAAGYHALHSRRYYEFWAKMVEPWASRIGPDSRFFPMFSERRKRMKEMAFRGDRLWLFPDKYRPEWQLADLYRPGFLSLANVGYLISRDRLMNPSLIPIREVPVPWSALSVREKTAENVRANFHGRRYFYIYRNTDVFPRFFTVSGVHVFDGSQALLDAMADASVGDLRRRAFVARRDLPQGMAPEQDFSHREIEIDRYDKDEIRLRLDGQGAALLIVSNSYSPFWSVEIDGVEAKIFPAYHTFWGVPIPATAKSVVFNYRPPY